MRRKISAHVDGGLSGGSRVRRPGSEDPHRRERKFVKFCYPDVDGVWNLRLDSINLHRGIVFVKQKVKQGSPCLHSVVVLTG